MRTDPSRTVWVVGSSSIRLTTRGGSLVKGMMEREGKRSDVLPEFWSGKNSQTISVHAVANQLAPRKCFN